MKVLTLVASMTQARDMIHSKFARVSHGANTIAGAGPTLRDSSQSESRCCIDVTAPAPGHRPGRRNQWLFALNALLIDQIIRFQSAAFSVAAEDELYT